MEAEAIRPAPVVVRLMDPSEEPLVLDSWVRSYKATADESPLVSALSPEAYRAAQRAVAHRLLERSHVYVACFPSVPDEVTGYIVAQQGLIHWLYVKKDYRRCGIARSLLWEALKTTPLNAQLQHTHESETGRVIARKLRSQFNPKAAR